MCHSHTDLIERGQNSVAESGLQSLELGEKQSVELCDNIGRMLALELNSQVVKSKVKRLVVDYMNKRDIADDPERLLKKLEWTVRVRIGR
jgi:hypothetical protein